MRDSDNVPGADADGRLDALIAYLQRYGVPELNRWFVESLAEAMDVNIIPVPDDPLDQADALAERWVTAVWMAGRDTSLRSVACRRAIGKLKGLMDVLDEWMEEAGEE